MRYGREPNQVTSMRMEMDKVDLIKLSSDAIESDMIHDRSIGMNGRIVPADVRGKVD